MKPVLALICALLGIWSCAVHAAPPPGSDPNSPLSLWVRGLHRESSGQLCCALSDCRPTRIRYTRDGIEAWIGKDQYGANAPDEWRPVPPYILDDTVANGPAPDMRAAWVCYFGEKVICAVVGEGG